jgi:hypothetical protein
MPTSPNPPHPPAPVTGPSTPTTVTIPTTAVAAKKEVDLVAERKKADENIKQKQEVLTKANEACAKAHNDLMEAQREAAHLPPVPVVLPPVI